MNVFVMLYISIHICSHKDSDIMNQIFWTKDCPDMESFLEKEYQYRLNIHTRDFELGRTIDSNMEEAITCSRRLIVLLSR